MDDNLVWSAYERNCLYYYKCKDVNTCPSSGVYDDEIDDYEKDKKCYCHQNSVVYPKVIADCGFSSGIKPDINKKCYIRFGEICSICTDPIITKSSAWLTPCGHSFHRKCLIENFQYRLNNNMTIEYSNEIPCPICRTGHIWCCVGLENIDRFNNYNGLDKLENFWLSIDLKQYLMCYKCDKGLGMNKSCINCENYRNTGNI